MRLFMDKGDSILCEEYTYPHVPESLVIPMGFKSVGIKIDERGVIPGHLLETLEKMQAAGTKMPRLLYTIPIGQNPTGGTSLLEAHLCSPSTSPLHTPVFWHSWPPQHSLQPYHQAHSLI